MDTPDSLVRSFISALSNRDIDTAATMVSEGFEYDNVPIGKAHGAEGLRSTLTGFFGMLEDLDRGTVLNERDDRVKIAGEWRTLPVCGVFEIENGKIVLWRDYFDRATLMTVMGAGGQ
jgi:limonene-1,2-epoxide hydrolase